VVRAVADVLAGVSGLLASRQLDPDMRASAWELQASVLALSLELGMWYPEVTEWLDEQGTWITGVTRKVPSDFEEWVVLSRQARRMSAMLTVWARGGMRRWPPSAEFI
jgi:hypothetical protein